MTKDIAARPGRRDVVKLVTVPEDSYISQVPARRYHDCSQSEARVTTTSAAADRRDIEHVTYSSCMPDTYAFWR